MRALTRSPRKLEAELERQYGRDCLESILLCGHSLTVPVPIMGVGAAVYKGHIIPREAPSLSSLVRRNLLRGHGERGTGFASFSDLISEATSGGKRQDLMYTKTGVAAPAVSASQSLWAVGALPSAGSNASGPPGGTAPDDTTVGGLGAKDPGGSDTTHLCTWNGIATIPGSLMLYDYLFGVNVSEATAQNTISGTQSRYTGSSGSTYAAGAFVTGRVTTVRAATTPNVTITYIDQDGNTAEAGSAQALRSAAAVNTIPFTAPKWAYDLNSGDLGLRNITDITYSATSTGITDWFIGKPLGILPQPVANIGYLLDGINSAFNLVQIQTNACLALMEFFKTATTAATYSGQIILVSG